MGSTAETRTTHGICSTWEGKRSIIFYPTDAGIASPWETYRQRCLSGLLTAEDVFAIRNATRAQDSQSTPPEEQTQEKI